MKITLLFKIQLPRIKVIMKAMGHHAFPSQHDFEKIFIWSLYYHHILPAGKPGSTDSNKA